MSAVGGHDIARALNRAHEDIPDAVLASARLHLLDALAVGMIAARRGPVQGVRMLVASGGAGSCTVIGSTDRTTAATAALVNGALIHSLEFDDTHVASVMHGSAVVAPAALAVAQESGRSGTDLIRAFVVGWELLIRIGLASPGRIQARGFQITSAAGAFAAAAVSGLIRRDADDAIANALGIAGSQAAGTFAFLADGDTVKAVQPAWAAHAGLLAAELARAGISGPESVFDGRYGFYSLYADDPDAAARLGDQIADLGVRWHLPEAAFKLVPCCHYIHPYLEALDSVIGADVTPDDVVRIHCRVPDGAAPVIAEPWPARQHPPKAHDARWSLPYVLGLFLRDRRISAAAFDGPSEPDIMVLADRMTAEPWADSGFPDRFPAWLSVELADGSTRIAEVPDVKGGHGRPIAAEDVIAKALGNLEDAGLSPSDASRLVHEVVERPQPDLTAIADLLGRSDADA